MPHAAVEQADRDLRRLIICQAKQPVINVPFSKRTGRVRNMHTAPMRHLQCLGCSLGGVWHLQVAHRGVGNRANGVPVDVFQTKRRVWGVTGAAVAAVAAAVAAETLCCVVVALACTLAASAGVG